MRAILLFFFSVGEISGMGYPNLEERYEQSNRGLITCYRAFVNLVRLRHGSDVGHMEGVSLRQMYLAFGGDTMLEGLPAEIQRAMYVSLDGYLADALNCSDAADDVRNAIPHGVTITLDDMGGEHVTFSAGYNVSPEGIPEGGNANIIPVPPAFRCGLPGKVL